MPGPIAAAVARISSAPACVAGLRPWARPSLATWRRTACRMPAGTGTSSTVAAPGPSRRATWDTNSGLPSLRRCTTASTSASAPGSMSRMSWGERPERTCGGLADSSAAITSLTSGSSGRLGGAVGGQQHHPGQPRGRREAQQQDGWAARRVQVIEDHGQRGGP